MTNEEVEERAVKMLEILAGITNRNIEEAIEITSAMLHGLIITQKG